MNASLPPGLLAPPTWSDLRRTNPNRAFVLMGMGALAGLVVAGVSLFTAKGTSTLVVPPDAVATVNQQPISRIDFESQLRALGVEPAQATPSQRRQVLEDMIREELFVQRGKELDVATVDPEVRGAIVKAVEAQAAANAVTSRPSEADLRAFYAAHRDKYASEGTMALQDLVFPPAAATAAGAGLAAGQSPAAVASRFGGVDSGRVKGEEFYFAAKIHLGDALFAAAKSLASGAASPPIAGPDGTHVLVMIRNVAPTPQAFEAARTQVATDLQADAITRYERADAIFLRKRANILIADDLK